MPAIVGGRTFSSLNTPQPRTPYERLQTPAHAPHLSFASPLVLALASAANGKSIGRDQVNIREQPSLNSPILFTVSIGYPIEIKKQNGDWILFTDWQNNNGWVYKSLVSDIDTAVILVDKANIRSTASLNSSVVTTAQIVEIYTILTKDNDWVKLGYYESGTTVGWIRDDLIFGE